MSTASVEKNLELVRFQNEKEAIKRKEEVYMTIPAIADIDNEIASLAIAFGKSQLLQGANYESKEAYIEQRTQLSNKKIALLQEHGYSTDYLNPIYSCPLCQDTGKVHGNPCTCYKKIKAQLLFDQSPIRDRLKDETFSRFDLRYYSHDIDQRYGISPHENAKNAVQFCQDYVAHFEDYKANLIFTGTSGVGKTFLSNCIANQLMEQGYSVIYVTAHQLFDTLSKYSFEHTKSEAVQSILNCDLLIIDDLGTELTNRFVNSELFTCINERSIHKMGTIISTNLSLKAMQETYSERITSRFFEFYQIIMLFGEDIRLKK